MKFPAILLTILISVSPFARAQVPVTPNPDHETMLRHADPKLAANKRFVYDFWREVFEAAQFDLFRVVDGKIAEHWDPATK